MRADPPDPAVGLSEEEAARRVAARGPVRPPAGSRSYASIVRANLLTVFNLILVVAGVATLAYGDWRDALFLGILVANAAIGIAQEVRAKRALDRLAALVAPEGRVVRDGRTRAVPVEGVVPGDLVDLAPGDQVVADGTLVVAQGLELDESILTGESRPVARGEGQDVRSGSFVTEGAGRCVVTAVGPESYAERIAGAARAFRHPRSPLQVALDRLLWGLVIAMVPLALLLGVSLLARDRSTEDSVQTAVAAIVSLIPEGLILLASLTYAVAALRMARRGALAQELNAIESLASVDVLCTDKTGTLTTADLRVLGLAPAEGVAEADLAAALGRFAAAAPAPNRTLAAIGTAFAADPERPVAAIAFSSRRRWSAVELGDGAWVLGAPEALGLDGELRERASDEAARGRRVVAFARAQGSLADVDPEAGPPPARVLGLAILSERLRGDAAETIAFLHREGVEVKVLSGDAPATVAAIAADVGIGPGAALDGRALPADGRELAAAVAGASVIGRISPEEKRRVVEALHDDGRYVAMVGDGVNDVPALKAARLAIAQGSGVQMARSVADVVLVGGDFASVPPMVAQGRQVLRNVQRVAKLFVTKSVLAAFLIVTLGTSSTAYPLLPRHFSLVATLTIGIPAFFLALAPSTGRWRPEGFLRDVARFAVPAGLAAGAGVLAGYLLALHGLDESVRESRTVATTILMVLGLCFVILLEGGGRSARRGVWWLCVAMAALYALSLAAPAVRDFYELSVLRLPLWLCVAAGTAIGLVVLRVGTRLAHTS